MSPEFCTASQSNLRRPHGSFEDYVFLKELFWYTHMKRPLDTSCFGSIIITNGRKIKIPISKVIREMTV